MENIHGKGISTVTKLPDPNLEKLWNSIIVDESTKSRLLSQAIVNFTIRPKIDRSVIPFHGIILLSGPPGTGKTSLAKGLANETAAILGSNKEKIMLIEIEPHGLTSSAMGKTQKAVTDLFSQTISESAVSGKVIVLLDEVETLAVDRNKLSLEANPVDIHRATDAVLVEIDRLAESNNNILFIATSNFSTAVDKAFISRCDLIEEIPNPPKEVCKEILKHCLIGFSDFFPKIAQLVENKNFDECASNFYGLDGRTIRKVVANALASDKNLALYPENLTIDNLTEAAKFAVKNRIEKEQD